MADFLSIQEAMKKGKGDVSIRGWIYRERGSNKLKFIILRDSTNLIQCVLSKKDIGEEKFAIVDKVQVETSMEIHGTVKKDDRAPTGYEIQVKDFVVIGDSDILDPANEDIVSNNMGGWNSVLDLTSFKKKSKKKKS